MLKQQQLLSGTVKGTYISEEKRLGTDHSYHDLTADSDSFRERIGILSRLTKYFPWCMYKEIDPPKKIHCVEAVRGKITYVTNNSWRLDGLYCRNRNGKIFYFLIGIIPY